jgi:hypothetical protein
VTNEVIVPATATDRSGDFLLDIPQKDFHVFDDGVEQTIDHWDLGGCGSSRRNYFHGPQHLGAGIVSANMVAVLVAVGLWVRGAARRTESGSAFLDLTDNT